MEMNEKAPNFPQMLNNSLWHYKYKPLASYTWTIKEAGANQITLVVEKQINGFSQYCTI